MLVNAVAALSLASLAMAHSNMFFPIPRRDSNFAVQKAGGNACENTKTDIPPENNFKRGQSIPVKWWWNNHKGGFIKMAIVPGIKGTLDNAPFLDNKNIIQGQCYYSGCDDKGFDPGNTHPCVGKNLTIPNFLADGEYILQWSQIGGFDSDGIPTKQLPLYHTCANVKISGGAPKVDQPADFVAPFFGGDQFKINGKASNDDQCAFKRFDAEPADPAQQDVNAGVKTNDMKFGPPGGWAAKSGSAPAPATAPTPGKATAAPAPKGGSYVVKSGDTCEAISKAKSVSLDAILKNNPSVNKDCTNLEIGQTLTLRRRSRIMI